MMVVIAWLPIYGTTTMGRQAISPPPINVLELKNWDYKTFLKAAGRMGAKTSMPWLMSSVCCIHCAAWAGPAGQLMRCALTVSTDLSNI
eukprot:scaffold183709_cov19-Prasinocladus_malaysianus.AAC.1